MPTSIRIALLCSALLACNAERRVPEAPTWRLVETLRIGAGDEGPTSFSWVKGIAEDSAGRIFIYEHSTQDIRVFDASGTHVQTIGRRGAGPGELGNAEGIVFGGDGALWVRDAANGRFTRFTAAGDVLEAWPMSYCWSQGTWAPRVTPQRLVDYDCAPGRGGDYHVVGYRTDRSGIDSLAAMASCGSPELAEAATWITRTAAGTTYRPVPYAPRGLSTFDAAGATWCVPNSATYEILRLAPSGDTVRVTRDLPPIPVSQAERDSVISDIESRGPTGVDFSRIPATKPAIDRITVDDQERLWVRRNRPEGGILFDLYRADGTHEATVSLDGVRTSTWAPFVVKGDIVLLVIVGEDDVPQVGRFRIDRGT